MNTRIVLVGYPLEGNLQTRSDEILKICISIQRAKYIPVAPQILAIADPLNNDDQVRRVVSNSSQMCLCDGLVDELWLYGGKMTRDMITFVRLACRYKIKVVPKSDMTRRILGHKN